jgi:hypothetical protein
MTKKPASTASGESSVRRARIPVKLHRHVSLIISNDAHLAEELLARKKLAGLLAGRLTGQVVLVRPGQEAAVIEELRKIGQAPQVIRGGSA